MTTPITPGERHWVEVRAPKEGERFICGRLIYTADRDYTNTAHPVIQVDQPAPLDVRPLLTSEALAAYLTIPERTLDQWAYLERGPAFIKIGRHRRYRPDDVETWLLMQRKAVPA